MDPKGILLIKYLINGSIVIFLIPFAAALIKYIIGLFKNPKKAKGGIGAAVLFSAFLALALCCLRYAAGITAIFAAGQPMPMDYVQEIFRSLIGTLQNFGAGESYADYIAEMEQMIAAVVQDQSQWSNAMHWVLMLYASLLSVLAPLASGAIIFEILASIFPRFKLAVSQLAVWRKKYYFSELNAASLALAKSFLETNRSFFKKPVIVFTDAYIDCNDEKKGELRAEAKAIGALCIKTDVAHIRKCRLGAKAFFIMDENETGNLETLTALFSESNISAMRKAEVFYLTESDAYLEVEKRIGDLLNGKYGDADRNGPSFIPIQSTRNMISNLLVEVPLYEPLLKKPKNADGTQDLNVTILGAGGIGREMFLSTYWMGQMLGCRLHIHLRSQESEKEFWNKINYINPEIKETTQEGSKILTINKKGEKAPVYCTVDYQQCNVQSSLLIKELKEDLLQTDYYLVALGADDLNISVANTIKRYAGERCGRGTVIAYVVYDDAIAETLNRKTIYHFNGGSTAIYMRAIGNASAVYSVENILLNKYKKSAEEIHNAYLSAQGKKKRVSLYKERMENDYKYWANLARSMHMKYKLFSLGIPYPSVFSVSEVDEAQHKTAVAKAQELVWQEPHRNLELLHQMAWMEKRRWNAYHRTRGFRCPADYHNYAKDCGYKQMELKLHPCLVECDDRGIRAELNPDGSVNEKTALQSKDTENFDLLDELSYDLKKEGLNDYDFKMYDYPHGDFKKPKEKEKEHV